MVETFQNLAKPTLEVINLVKYFPIRQSLIDMLLRKPIHQVKAVDDISFQIAQGEVLALVGESGCGKTTIAKMVIGLENPTSGSIYFDGQSLEMSARHQRVSLAPLESGAPSSRIASLSQASITLRRLRLHAQMIFQDPYESLNPRATIMDIVSEPLVVHGLARNRAERWQRVKTALEDAGLRPAEDYFLRYPHELSGGQRQRVVIAGALVLEPELLLADEPVSMLDVSIRAEILNLLNDLRQKRGISILFITHDLSTVAYFADRIAVMYLGRIVEIGTTKEILQNPKHPYTQALLSVVPVPNPRLRRKRVVLQGETPNPIDVPTGCRFHPRCPQVFDRCSTMDPKLVNITLSAQTQENHQAACLLVKE